MMMSHTSQIKEGFSYFMGGEAFHRDLQQGFRGVIVKIYSDGSIDILSECGKDQTVTMDLILAGEQWIDYATGYQE